MQTPAGPRQRTDPYTGAATQLADGAAGEAGPGLDPVGTEDSAPPSGPVFVDASGRRRKLARRASLAAVAILAGYAGLLAVSFAGGPIPPNALLPVPGIPAGRQQAPAPSSSDPAGAAPSTRSSADHAAEAGRSATGTSDHRIEPRATTSNGSVRQSTPPQPQTTAPAGTATSTPAAPPTPTGTTTTTATAPANTHGNPTPPGHTRHT